MQAVNRSAWPNCHDSIMVKSHFKANHKFSTSCKQTLDTEHVFSYNRNCYISSSEQTCGLLSSGHMLGAAAVTKGKLQCAPQTPYRTGKRTFWITSRILFKIMATHPRSAKSKSSSISRRHR